MSYEFERPFGTIENAQEYMRLLADVVLEAKRELEAQTGQETTPSSSRDIQALRVALFSVNKLDHHIRVILRVLNDLRSLRRLMLQERSQEPIHKPPRSVPNAVGRGKHLPAEPGVLPLAE